MSQTTVREWFTLKEVSEITGRSLNSIRLLVHRKKIADIKKVVENGREQWMVHRSALAALSSATDLKKDDLDRCNNCTMKDGEDPSVCEEICGRSNVEPQDVCHSIVSENPKNGVDQPDKEVRGALVAKGYKDPVSELYVASIPLDHYEKKQKEWSEERDRLLQGILLYRYRYEELSTKIKALPLPPEHMQTKITELEESLKQEKGAKSDALLKIEQHLTEVIDESREMRTFYETQLIEAKNSFSRDSEDKVNTIKELESREKELMSLLELRDLELSEARKPWWKKLLGIK